MILTRMKPIVNGRQQVEVSTVYLVEIILVGGGVRKAGEEESYCRKLWVADGRFHWASNDEVICFVVGKICRLSVSYDLGDLTTTTILSSLFSLPLSPLPII